MGSLVRLALHYALELPKNSREPQPSYRLGLLISKDVKPCMVDVRSNEVVHPNVIYRRNSVRRLRRSICLSYWRFDCLQLWFNVKSTTLLLLLEVEEAW
eukprot:scaffold22390_cov28-Tisochrysis_lutea.AAC.15